MGFREEWPPRRNVAAPIVERGIGEAFGRIGGASSTGLPRLRLVWGQEVRERIDGNEVLRYALGTVAFLSGWEASYFDCAGQLVRKKSYPASTEAPRVKKPKRGTVLIAPVVETEEIGIPRFFVEQLVEPDLIMGDWDRAREAAKAETGTDLLDEDPRKGIYLDAFHMIASHGDCGCDRYGRLPGGVKCYGAYRPPDRRDVKYVEWMLGELKGEAYKYDWHEMPPQDVVEQAVRDYESRNEKALERRVQNYEEQFGDLLRPHLRRVTEGSTGGLDKFRYHDIGAAFQKGLKAGTVREFKVEG